MSLFVGIVFVLRDFSQKEIGHKVFFVMAIGAIISYFMASPFVAIASLSAYVVSEIIDWSIYSFSRMTINKRILISSIISCPIDSFVFLIWISNDQAWKGPYSPPSKESRALILRKRIESQNSISRWDFSNKFIEHDIFDLFG